MIKRLKNTDIKIAKLIRSVFQSSYKVEAELLKAIDFPPLKRTLENYRISESLFFGFYSDKTLAGVVEIIHNSELTHIRSLVVDPSYFRQGIATKLMQFALNTFESDLFIVETGLDNQPAINLYQNLNFKQVEQWDTNHGIRKVKFERRIGSEIH